MASDLLESTWGHIVCSRGADHRRWDLQSVTSRPATSSYIELGTSAAWDWIGFENLKDLIKLEHPLAGKAGGGGLLRNRSQQSVQWIVAVVLLLPSICHTYINWNREEELYRSHSGSSIRVHRVQVWRLATDSLWTKPFLAKSCY